MMDYRIAKTQIVKNGTRFQIEGEWDYKRGRFPDDSEIIIIAMSDKISKMPDKADILKAASHEYHERQWGRGDYI